MSRTISAKKEWFSYLSDKCEAISFDSLRNMRKTLWGDEAYVVRCCRYLFRVSEKDFNYLKENV